MEIEMNPERYHAGNRNADWAPAQDVEDQIDERPDSFVGPEGEVWLLEEHPTLGSVYIREKTLHEKS